MSEPKTSHVSWKDHKIATVSTLDSVNLEPILAMASVTENVSNHLQSACTCTSIGGHIYNKNVVYSDVEH